jgi:hypothetical protein
MLPHSIATLAPWRLQSPFQVGFGEAKPPQDSFFCALPCGFAARQRAKISACEGRRPARSRRCNRHDTRTPSLDRSQ